MTDRHRVFLRSTSTINKDGRKMVSLPKNVWKALGWKVNDKLQIDIIKVGMVPSVNIIKETEG